MKQSRGRYLIFLMIALTYHSLSQAAAKPFDDQLLEALPSPIAFLKSVDSAGENIQSSLLEEIEITCQTSARNSVARTQKGCRIPELVKKYAQLLSALKGGAHGIDLNASLKTKVWDLSALVAGQFLLVPSPRNQNAGLDLVVDLITTRDEISREIEHYYEPANKQIDSPNPLKVLAAPYLKAYITTSSPLGALNVVYQSIQCAPRDLACRNTKLLWQNVCSIAIQTNSKSFEDIDHRLKLAIDDSSSKTLVRLKFVKSLHDYISSSPFDKVTLRQKLIELDKDGQSGFVDSDYADLAIQFLVFNEIDHLIQLKSSCQSAPIKLSQKTFIKFENEMTNISSKSFEDIENAIVKFGVLNEAGGAQ